MNIHTFILGHTCMPIIIISATAKDETKFVEEAVHQLLKARRVLKFSYVYGYYLDGPQYRKLVFEFMQVSWSICSLK